MEPRGEKRSLKKIGTHNGSFHCDEALACYLLRLTPEFQDAEIVRTRDPKLLQTMDVVVDVGGEYDPSRHRYDHHQKEFNGTLDENHSIKLSSAGLIYKHFGKQIIQHLLKTDERQTNQLFYLVYKKFVEALDATDNGISQFGDAKPLYEAHTSLPSRVAFLNPFWNDPNPENADNLFLKAVQLAGTEFLDCLNYYAKAWMPAREIVEKAFLDRVALLGDERLLLLPVGCPWKDHLMDVEAEHKANPIIFILFGDNNGSWRVQGVPKFSGSFECRVFLPAEWRGLRDEVLSTLTGIPGCIFVHASGFIGGHKTKEGAIEMARKALQMI